MKVEAKQLADDLMALPEEERLGIFFRLAGSLPFDAAQLAESARRAEEMHSGVVRSITEPEFNDRMATLSDRFRKR
ncbi:MAG: hypothetical protein JJT75_04150 [Opitutales bacterium]|nr:hypothetical protein [Opitutales bacterium]MCH8540882.1 hypothetical protein [Opitutales bacterium]